MGMKMIIAVIQDEIINGVLRDFTEAGIRSTKLSSSGGFLKAGSTTLIIGVEKDEIEKLVEIIEENSEIIKRRRKNKEINVSAANLFVIDSKEFIKL